MSRPRVLVLALVLALAGLVACARSARPPSPSASPPSPSPSRRAAPPDRGSPADVHTTAGWLDGVEVVVACHDRGGVGLVSRGSAAPPAAAADAAAFNRWTDALVGHVRRALGPDVVAVGWGVGCRDGDVGPRVYVAHHATIDAIVPRLARFLREEDLALRAVVVVQPDREPL